MVLHSGAHSNSGNHVIGQCCQIIVYIMWTTNNDWTDIIPSDIPQVVNTENIIDAIFLLLWAVVFSISSFRVQSLQRNF